MVARESKGKDGSVEAWGVTTSGTGTGCDILIVDDPVDLRNAILNPALRSQIKDSLKNVWFTRVASNGFKIYIATVWHDDDATSELRANPEWCFLVIKVSEDFTHFDCESPLKGKFTLPLWDLWPTEKLKQRFKEIGARAFNRGYRQEAISDEDRTFPSSDTIFRWDLGRDIIPNHYPRVMGVDPFGQKVVIFVMAFEPTKHRRFPVHIRMGKWQPKQTIREIIDTYKEYACQLGVVENNAAQEAITQWAQEVGGHNLLLIPFTTGAQKANPEMGLPSLEVEFANGSWIIPMKGIDPTDSNNPWIIFKNELRAHPVGVAADTVMAAWFAREGVRFLCREDVPAEQAQETITQEEMGVESVQIGDY
jgi:hypothetical protein